MRRGEILCIKMMSGDMLLSVVTGRKSSDVISVISIDDTVRSIAYIAAKDVRYTSDGEKYDD